MKAPIRPFKQYVEETLGLTVNPVGWRGRDRVPVFLQDRYAFYEVEILETACILMVDGDEEELPPATIHKHMANVQAHTDDRLIYVRDRITAYNRKRLIAQKVPFLVPGNQMYLPMLGIDLREHFRKLRSESPKFSPSTQAVFIYLLLSERIVEITPSGMAKRLGYSPMTMTRAFDELESANLGVFTLRGRERCVVFPKQKSELWSNVQSLLRSPVKRRYYIRPLNVPSLKVRAGLTALAHYTMLAEPAKPTFAMMDEEWKALKQQHNVTIVPAHEPEAYEIEIWSYEPTLFAKKELVDRLSLYLSLRDNHDERVEAALEDLMEGLRW